MTKIQLRRDTATNWSTNNPTPAAGEPCYETDTGKFKIGNGTTPYNNLEYIGAGDLPDNITTQGNTFNGANQLVQMGSDGKLPAIDGSQLTNLPGGNIATIFEAVEVENNDSLNTFTTGGIYYFTSSTTNANKPIDNISGILEVIPKGSDDRIVQRFTRLSTTYYGCWVRTALGTAASLDWQEWKELTLSPATTTTLGGVKPDGSTITVDEDGTIHSVSSAPSNMMTTDTQQEIRASKQFDEGLIIYGANKELKVDGGGGYSLRLRQAGGTSYIISDHDSFDANKLILQGDTILCNRETGTGAGNNLINIDSGNISDYLSTGGFASQSSVDTINSALNGFKFWKGSQTEYNAIEAKDENTLYIITG